MICSNTYVYIILNDLKKFIRFVGFICHTILSVFIYIHVHVAGHFTQLIHPFSYLVKHPYLGCDDDYKMPCRSHFDRDYLQTFKKNVNNKTFLQILPSLLLTDFYAACILRFPYFHLNFFHDKNTIFGAGFFLKRYLNRNNIRD